MVSSGARRAVAGIILLTVVEEMWMRIALTLCLGILNTYPAVGDLCVNGSVRYIYETEFTYTLEEINLTPTVESILFDVIKAQEIVEIPITEDCSTSCHRRTLHGETEVVCNATDGGTSFSVHHRANEELQYEEGVASHLECSNSETVEGHSEIKCDAARGGNSVSVTIDLQPPSVVQCSLSAFIEFGVFVTCSSSLYTIHGMAYFINGIPINVIHDRKLNIGWGAFSSSSFSSSKLSLSVSVSNGELYHITFNIETPSACGVELSQEYRDSGEEIVVATTPIGDTTEIVGVTLLRDKKIIKDTNGSDITIPKALLKSGERVEFTVVFIVMCGGQHEFRLVRHLHMVSGCPVNCTASVEGNNIRVVCQESQGSSKIKSISYSQKEVEASEIVIVNYEIPSSIVPPTVLIVTCENGGKTIINITCYELMDLECMVQSSPCTQSDGVHINCTSNVPASSLTTLCSIDYVALEECGLYNFLNYSTLTDGKHMFSIKATDSSGINAENRIMFSVTFKIWCTAVYRSTQDAITVSCDSTRQIFSSVLQIKGGPAMECTLPCTISMTENMSATEDITISLKAEDHFGNLATDDNLYFLKIIK